MPSGPYRGRIPDSSPLLLGIDVGTSRTKVVLVDGAGAEVAMAEAPTPFVRGQGGVEAGVDDLMDALRSALGALGPACQRTQSVGVAGLAESGAPLDGACRPLARVIAWHDPRGGEVVAAIKAAAGEDLELRIGQRLRTVSSIAKLGWLVGHGVSGVRWWLGVPELVVHALTGSRVTDFSLAARTGAYDVVARRPLDGITDVLGLPHDVFPAPKPAGSVMGRVSAAGAAWSGFPVGIPVTVAGHDHLAAAAGCGAGAGDLVNSVGTAETVLGVCDRPPDIGRALSLGAAVTVRPAGDGWAVLASAARSGLVLDAAARTLGGAPAELDGLAEAAGTVEASAFVDELAASVKGGGDGVTAAAGSPAATAVPAGSPGEIWNGVLAALATRTWDAARRVDELCGPSTRLVVVGGGSHSRPWLRAKARTGFVPVVRSTVGEAVARGAAVYAGVAAGWWPTPAEAPPAPGGLPRGLIR